jgi:RNA polymerase sigma factor (TIGR02999 family)
VSARNSIDLTQLLESVAHDPAQEAVNQLVPALYNELRGLAEAHLRRERPGHTLSPTALVHEAYLRLIDQSRVHWQGRTHFFAIAAQSVRRVLLDHARARGREKRGGNQKRLTLSAADALAPQSEIDVLALEESLERLSASSPTDAQVVEMRFFGGLSLEEIAQVMGVHERTVRRRWNFAKAWLYAELQSGEIGPSA